MGGGGDIEDIFCLNDTVGWVVGNMFYKQNYTGTLIKKSTYKFQKGHWINEIYDSTKMYIRLRSIFFLNDSTGWVGGNYLSILKCDNKNGNWKKQQYYNGGDNTNNHINKIYFSDVNNGRAFSSTGTVYKTTNGGDEWIIESEKTISGIGKVQILKDGTIIASFINGIYKYVDKYLKVDESQAKNIEIFPNPARNLLNIRCNSDFEVSVFDILGNKFYSGFENKINTESFPSGYYICVIKTKGEVFTKSIIIAK
jgi:hypothetical protein